MGKCKHENVWPYVWTGALWRLAKILELPGLKMCGNCGAWLSLGHSDETDERVALELRAATIAADKKAKMSMCEAFGWEALLAPKFSTDPVDAGYSNKWHAGYLARCIVEHKDGES